MADMSKYPDILADISGGMSVKTACEKHKVPMSTFITNVDGDKYARARDAQADAHFVEMAELERECLSGAIDPQAYRAAMDTRKWRLARMKPKTYGDKIQQEISGPDGGPITVEAALAGGRTRAIERQKPQD